MEPHVIEPRMQRSTVDCGVACLEMFLGVPYADLAKRVRAKAGGINGHTMLRVAKKFGRPLRWKETAEVEDDAIGIIVITNPSDDHAVIYARNTIYDPATGQWWLDADEFLSSKGFTIVGILTRRIE